MLGGIYLMIQIENEHLIVQVKPEGAELTSIRSKKDGTEYLWNGNPEYWNRHAPILFPIVGRLINNTYFVEGVAYELPQHGFARDMTFDIVQQESDSISFSLQADEETLQKYPYQFTLIVTYILVENKVTIDYKVINNDSKNIYFSIGAHPAFNCPIEKKEAFEDYYFSFAEEEIMETYVLDGAYRKPNKETLLEPTNMLPLAVELFKNDAIILENMNKNEISIRSKKSDKFVTVRFDGFPYVGLWSKPEGAPFVCIEPWYGIADAVGESVELKEKKGIQQLAVDGVFHSSYQIVVG